MYVTYQTNFTEFGDAHPVDLEAPPHQDAKLRTVRAGQILFTEGDPARLIFRVGSGVLRLSRVTENGRRQVVAFGYPGDVLGFPLDGLYCADCDTLTSATLSVLPALALEHPLVYPQTNAFLVDRMAREISSMQDHFMMLGRKSAQEKVAAFILALMARAGRSGVSGCAVDLPMNRTDIADFLGITTETVSRMLTSLRSAGLIKLTTPQEVRVLDVPGLSRVAHGGD
ncbi:MAG: helix-turn-helix domain-containing protein [Pseudomonadota bacterium]